MKVVKKNVYYCDYCKKRGLSGGHMKSHETYCTANPNRNCRMCDENYNIVAIVEEYKSRFILVPHVEEFEGQVISESFKAKWVGEPVTLKEVRDRVSNCPNCLLAIIRQCQFGYHYFEGFEKFDYKTEFNQAMSDKNSEVEYYY